MGAQTILKFDYT